MITSWLGLKESHQEQRAMLEDVYSLTGALNALARQF